MATRMGAGFHVKFRSTRDWWADAIQYSIPNYVQLSASMFVKQHVFRWSLVQAQNQTIPINWNYLLSGRRLFVGHHCLSHNHIITDLSLSTELITFAFLYCLLNSSDYCASIIALSLLRLSSISDSFVFIFGLLLFDVSLCRLGFPVVFILVISRVRFARGFKWFFFSSQRSWSHLANRRRRNADFADECVCCSFAAMTAELWKDFSVDFFFDKYYILGYFFSIFVLQNIKYWIQNYSTLNWKCCNVHPSSLTPLDVVPFVRVISSPRNRHRLFRGWRSNQKPLISG